MQTAEISIGKCLSRIRFVTVGMEKETINSGVATTTLAGHTRLEPLLEVLVDVSILTYTKPKLSKTSRVVDGGGGLPVFFP